MQTSERTGGPLEEIATAPLVSARLLTMAAETLSDIEGGLDMSNACKDGVKAIEKCRKHLCRLCLTNVWDCVCL